MLAYSSGVRPPFEKVRRSRRDDARLAAGVLNPPPTFVYCIHICAMVEEVLRNLELRLAQRRRMLQHAAHVQRRLSKLVLLIFRMPSRNSAVSGCLRRVVIGMAGGSPMFPPALRSMRRTRKWQCRAA
eukprot:scaffold109_cov252-Pinguiococcus_pyrenoidosus.AAC.68